MGLKALLIAHIWPWFRSVSLRLQRFQLNLTPCKQLWYVLDFEAEPGHHAQHWHGSVLWARLSFNYLNGSCWQIPHLWDPSLWLLPPAPNNEVTGVWPHCPWRRHCPLFRGVHELKMEAGEVLDRPDLKTCLQWDQRASAELWRFFLFRATRVLLFVSRQGLHSLWRPPQKDSSALLLGLVSCRVRLG